MSAEQRELLDLIRVLGFNAFEAVLFLDTHPSDQQALMSYKKYQQLLEKATNEYTTHFGPLSSDNVNIENGWTWGNRPWPWESEAN